MKSDGSKVKEFLLEKEYMGHLYGLQEVIYCIYQITQRQVLYWSNEN